VTGRFIPDANAFNHKAFIARISAKP